MPPPVVLFDLDGTLSDSQPGILAALRYAFAQHDVAPLDPATERSLLGPPFYESLPPIVGTERLASVIAAYRSHYDTTMYETTVYPGVREVLEALHAEGRRVAVATSKPEFYARPIVEHLGLVQYFETVAGDAPDGSLPTKAQVIALALQRLGGPAPDDVVMVGDRSHDVLGARAHGIECIGVRWGYAGPDELESVQPQHIVSTAAELADALGVGRAAQT